MITSAQGNIKRIVAARMSPGEDVLLGLEKICRDYGIQNGVILNGIGSLDGAQFFNPVPLKDKKAGYGYSEAVVLRGPIELVNLSGMICHNEQGETLLHVHYGLTDQYGNGHGGHLIEGNKVLMTVDVIIGEIEGVDMGRGYDEDLEVFIFAPKQK